jgi:predicted metal-binding membrane protein
MSLGPRRVLPDHDRLVVLSALTALVLLAWAYLFWVQRQMAPAMMPDMPGMDMSGVSGMETSWNFPHFLFILAMWAVMMVGMMTPSVSPMILIFARVAEQAEAKGVIFASTAWFAGGYLLAWCVFSLAATMAQYLLDRAMLLSPMMALDNRFLIAAFLAAAGIYQLTPLKRACLASCRAPIAFIQRHGGFRPDAAGALRLGFLHGLYCVGCCWVLMALLFVGGVMNPVWIAGLMVFVLAEKLLPLEPYISGLAGLVALVAAAWTAF